VTIPVVVVVVPVVPVQQVIQLRPVKVTVEQEQSLRLSDPRLLTQAAAVVVHVALEEQEEQVAAVAAMSHLMVPII
jgi:hypothetical protein